MTQLITISQILPGATPFRFANINETFRAQVAVTPADVRNAIVKDLPAKQLANEAFVSVLALTLGLPVPPPHLCLAEGSVLPVKHAPTIADGRHVLFGSEDVSSPPVAAYLWPAFIAPAVKDAVRKRIGSWSGIGGAYGLDTWVANIDRHEGNLLIASSGQIWLIDHGASFTGQAWMAASLDAASKYANRLSNWLTPSMTDDERSQALARAHLIADAAAALDVDQVAQLNFLNGLLSTDDYDAVLKFLKDRIPHTKPLAAEALGYVI